MDAHNKNEVTLDKSEVQKNATKRKKSSRRTEYHEWIVKENGDLGIQLDQGIPGVISPAEGDPAVIEFRFNTSGGRSSHLEMEPEAWFVTGENEVAIDAYVESQAWPQGKGNTNPIPNGDEKVACQADSFTMQIVATDVLAGILGAIPDSYLAGMEKGNLIRSKATPWLALRLFNQRKTKEINLSPAPMFGLENVRPPLPNGTGQGYERNVAPAKVWAHAVVDGKEIRARNAVETLAIDDSVRDVHFRIAVSPHLVQLLQESTQLSGVTYDTTKSLTQVDFIS